MRANLDAAGGFPLAEHVAALLAPALGRAAAHDLVAAGQRAGRGGGRPLRDGLLDRGAGARLAAAGITPAQLDAGPRPGRLPGRGR